MTDKKRRGRGRPPTRRPEQKPATLSLKPETVERYKALAELTGRPTYQVMLTAVVKRFDRLPDGRRRRLDEIAARQEAEEPPEGPDGE